MNESAQAGTIAPMGNVGQRIRRVREAVSGRTQSEFAHFLGGVSRGAIGNWELGRGIKRENLNRIAQRTGVSVDWLMNGPDDGPIPFLPTQEGQAMANIVNDETLAAPDAISGLTMLLQALGFVDNEAFVLARIILGVIRTRTTPDGQLLSDREKRLLIETAIHPFLPR